MGTNFLAILNAEPVKERWDTIVELSKREDAICTELRNVLSANEISLGQPTWVLSNDYSHVVPAPVVLSTEYSLRTSDGFQILFQDHCIGIWHFLRWPRFIQNSDWQAAVLAACQTFISLFEATDAIVTRDGAALERDFRMGLPYSRIVTGRCDGETEVKHVKDLLQRVDSSDWSSKGFWRIPSTQQP